MKVKTEERKQRIALTGLFTGVAAGVFIITLLVVGTAVFLLAQSNVLGSADDIDSLAARIIITFAVASFIVSAVLTFFTMKIPLRPVNKLINGMNSLATGDYKVRISYGEIWGKHPTVAELTASFNQMAAELENTEMLRSDFVNNFSHEFKTPIVSIAGFAKLLRKGNLTAQQQIEYLDIIEEESLRLSQMATNILNLKKVENQTILTDTTEYNLSEQVRSCILLLEDKWTKKNIELDVSFDEHTVIANEELLKQVWINLVDNAVKFSPEFGEIAINMTETEEAVSVSIRNSGKDIPSESIDKVFNKFYQVDKSRSTDGNGIGLAVVKRIVDLHGGKVMLKSADEITVFTVELPKK